MDSFCLYRLTYSYTWKLVFIPHVGILAVGVDKELLTHIDLDSTREGYFV